MSLDNPNNEYLLPEEEIASWAKIGDFYWPTIDRIIGNVMEALIRDGVYSEAKVRTLLASYGLQWPIANQFLAIAQNFICNFCSSATKPTQEMSTALNHKQSMKKYNICFIVFYKGRDTYYYDTLPENILNLRNTVLFWIYPTKGEYYSQGQAQKRLRPQTVNVLRFLSSKQNEGKTISIADIYKTVWQVNPPNKYKMNNSVGVEISELNWFADPIAFESITNAKAIITRSANAYIIKKELMNECCIIEQIERPVTTPKIHK
jgi:hypothetical protein